MESTEAVPVYALPIEFYSTFLGLRHETGAKYLKLGVLVPDAATALSRRPLFKVDPESIERHRKAILAFRVRQRAVRYNLKELADVG
jgi:hypothetical protein